MEQWKHDFAETIAKHRRQGWGWRYDGMDDWSNQRIFTQLQKLGIDTDAKRFRRQAITAGGIDQLQTDWTRQIREEMDTAFWPDFPQVAIPVLWERLAADLVCPEIVDERIHRAISAGEEGTELPLVNGLPAGVSAALGLANFLQGFPAAERAAQFREVCHHSYYKYESWLLDLIATEGKDHPDEMTRLADVMADCENGRRFQDEGAMLMAFVGRREQAVERAHAILGQYNEDTSSHILAGDVYAQLDEMEEAKRHYTEGIAEATRPDAAEVARERLKELIDESKHEFKPTTSLMSTLGPTRTSAPSAETLRREDTISAKSAGSVQTAKKVGRNDMCPCGSGKKYKKCCLRG